MSESFDDTEESHAGENRVLLENYVPGSSLASVDAKIAELDKMFKKLCKSAGR